MTPVRHTKRVIRHALFFDAGNIEPRDHPKHSGRPMAALSLSYSLSLWFVWHKMQGFAVESGKHPTDVGDTRGLFESRDFAPADARVSALQLNQPNLECIGVLAIQPKGNRVYDARARRARLAFKERDVPTVGHAVSLQRLLTRGFRVVRFLERSLAAYGLPRFKRGFSPVAHKGILAPGPRDGHIVEG
jgi:hypothetical protein